MRYIKNGILAILILITFTNIQLLGQNKSDTQIDIIFDASGSMWGQIEGKCKITIAREVLSDLLKDFEKRNDIELALRVYGHLNKQCDNTVLEVPMGFDNHSIIADKVNSIQPLGKTPIAFSLLESVNDFNLEKNVEKTILFITDGIESCDGNPCDAAQTLKNSGIVTKIHIVGFGMKEDEVESLKCIAEPFDGKVLGASNAEELKDAFKAISEEISLEKNVEIIGLDINDDKVYMDVDIYQNDDLLISSYGTITKFYLSEGTYNVIAKSRDTDITITKTVSIAESGYNKFEIIFAEGTIKLMAVNSTDEPIYTFYSIYNKNGAEILSTEGSGKIEKSIIPGTYDVKAYEQDTYSTLWIKDIQVNAGETVDKVFSFAMGNLNIIPQDSNGNSSSRYWWYTFYNNDTGEKLKVSAEGVGIKDVEILPGVYSISVIDDYNNEVASVNDIKIDAGEITAINIIVE